MGKCAESLGPVGCVVPIAPLRIVAGLAPDPEGGGPIVMLGAVTMPVIPTPDGVLPTAASVTGPAAVIVPRAMLLAEILTALSGAPSPTRLKLARPLAE